MTAGTTIHTYFQCYFPHSDYLHKLNLDLICVYTYRHIKPHQKHPATDLAGVSLLSFPH